MSFITKRERVFHEVEFSDLPPRNEGKLKAYASCTDARAWSHFGSSKTEHLTELIKRNNDLSAPAKYVPTKVIVDTLMASKNLEVARLKRKIEEFEQMLAVYEELDLDCAQKCEIAKAHASIKAANRDLDDLCLNLDMSTCTDAFESESFETGKSRSVQYSANWSIKSKGGESDRSRGDPWIVMADKDLASQGNQTSLECTCDACVCEFVLRATYPFTACTRHRCHAVYQDPLKIMENDICEPFGIYAHIYTALEKIYGILSQNSKYKQYLNLMTAGKDTRCIDIKGRILFKMKVLEKFCLALIAPCSKEFNCENSKDCPCFYADVSTRIENTYRITPADSTSLESIKRSQLVADIMENEEMKEILSKESTPETNDDLETDTVLDTACTINEENQKRIKDLQECYDDLMNCYENLKHETECIRIKCSKYEELELELARLRGQLNEFNSLWNEKEHYRKRSEDLDALKQQYMVLAEESSGLETKLKAESEINRIKADAIDELRTHNMSLEKRLNELYISFEKDKNNLQCQLQESECKCMCQAQQIKSLNSQIMKLLEQQPENIPQEDNSLTQKVVEENETLKEQLKQYMDIEYEFRDKMARINELELEIVKWRDDYKKVAEHNNYLQNTIEKHESEKESLQNENRRLLHEITEKSNAVENLMGVLEIKSLEIHKLTDINQNYSSQLSRQESQEYLQKVKDYDDFVLKQEELSSVIDEKMHEYESLKKILKQKLEENEKLKMKLNLLQTEDSQNKRSLEITKKESAILERRLSEFENISQQFLQLKEAFERLSAEKKGLEGELRKTASQLDSAMYSVNLNKKESGKLLKQSESIKVELAKLYSNNESLQKELDILRDENKELKLRSQRLSELEQELSDLKKTINDVVKEKMELEHAFKVNGQEISNLCSIVESKIEENKTLNGQLETLENENKHYQAELDKNKRESLDLMEKLQNHNELNNEYKDLKTDHEAIKLEKERLQKELASKLLDLKKIQGEKIELQGRTDDLLAHSNDLEKTLTATRNELLSTQLSPPVKTPYADLMNEIQKLRLEKDDGQKKIRELLHKLDESEQIISNFDAELHVRDCRIAVMQNQINDLEDEIRRLQNLLGQAIDAGNDITYTTHSIEEARKQIEAHHSKASHNMKLELAVLQRSKSKLEDQLSITKSQYETSSKDKQSYFSVMNDLKNDREIIVTDIKQLEIYSVGDSELKPDDCEIELILNSIDRIRKSFEARNAKTVTLEQTLAKIQNSSLLVLNKADEAKQFFENEKQKIIHEKDEALKEKSSIQQQLNDLKNELNKQISQDGNIINDLQAEISNQKLIINKINDSTKAYITKLKDEMKSLKDLYKNAQENLKMITEEKVSKENVIKSLIADLENKTKEVSELNAKLNDLAKDFKDKAVQIPTSDNYRNISSQTDNDLYNKFFDMTGSNLSVDQIPDDEKIKVNKPQLKDAIQPMHDILPQQKHPSLNEVKILAAKVEPTFDFVRSSYLNYKIKRLRPGLLEYYSFPSLAPSVHSYNEELPEMSNNFPKSENPFKPQDNKNRASNEGLVDIYHSPSDNIQSSSKMIGVSSQDESAVPYGLKRDSVRPEMKSNSSFGEAVEVGQNDTNVQTIAKPQYEQLFTRIDQLNKQYYIKSGEKYLKSTSSTDEPSTSQVAKGRDKGTEISKTAVKIETTAPIHFTERETYRTKQKLNINLPRVGIENKSFATATDNDNNSFDSFTLDIHSDPMKGTLSDTTALIESSSEYNTKSGTPSLPAIQNADDIHIKSRSYLELPSKDSSFTKSSSQPEIRCSSNKLYERPGDFIIYGDSGVGLTEPQHLFSFVEKIQQPDSKAINTTVNFVTNDIRNAKRGQMSEHNLSRDILVSSDIFITKASMLRRRRSSHCSGHSSDDNKEYYYLLDEKSKDSNNQMPQQNLDVSRGRSGSNRKRKAKPSEMTTGDVDRHNDNNSDGIIGSSIRDQKDESQISRHDLVRVEAEPFLKVLKISSNLHDDNSDNTPQEKRSDFALTYILDSFKPDPGDLSVKPVQSYERYANARIQSWIELTKHDDKSEAVKCPKSVDQGVTANLETSLVFYEHEIASLRKSLVEAEKDHKMQIEAIKMQYDRHINSIINDHNIGVMNIQSLHEETLRDITRVHENEVESLRSMSIDAMRKVEKLEKECSSLRSKISIDNSLLDEVPTKCVGLEIKKHSDKPQSEKKMLTKTNVEAFDVKPKIRGHGPCTCSLDINISDTIRNIFEQVDADQRKMAEKTYLKYIASKISNGHIEALDTQELSFLHLKVCRTWKLKLNKEEALQKKIDSLEVELMKKQKSAQQHMAELDRKVAQEKRRLEEVREAVCRSTPATVPEAMPLPLRATMDNRCSCDNERQAVAERRSAGDLTSAALGVTRTKKTKAEHRAVVLRTDAEERRDRRLYTDEPPTRLRRQHDRPPSRSAKK